MNKTFKVNIAGGWGKPPNIPEAWPRLYRRHGSQTIHISDRDGQTRCGRVSSYMHRYRSWLEKKPQGVRHCEECGTREELAEIMERERREYWRDIHLSMRDYWTRGNDDD